MNFIKTIGLGVLIGFIIGLLGLIPFCSCFSGPFLCLFGGYFITKIMRIKNDDYNTLFTIILVYACSGAIIATIIAYIINMFYGPTLTSILNMESIFSITGMFNEIIFPLFYHGMMLFIFGFVGGLIRMFTKK